METELELGTSEARRCDDLSARMGIAAIGRVAADASFASINMKDSVLLPEHLTFGQAVGSFAGVGAALLCSVVTIATGVTQADGLPKVDLTQSKTIMYNSSSAGVESQ